MTNTHNKKELPPPYPSEALPFLSMGRAVVPQTQGTAAPHGSMQGARHWVWPCLSCLLPISSQTHNNKMTQRRMTSAMASPAAHGPLVSVLMQCTSSPLHLRCWAHLVCFILCSGVSFVTFLSVHFEVKFCQSGVMSATASAPTRGNLPPVPVWFACAPH